ncbi:MAG: hypothetical protein R2882_09385 [Gemmatimonadales bacterium]
MKPGQQLVKVVYDETVAMLGEKQAPIAFASVPPTVVMLVGLQGSGKTTTADSPGQAPRKLEQKTPFLWPRTSIVRPRWSNSGTLAEAVDVGFHGEPGRTDVAGIVRRRGIEAAGKARARLGHHRHRRSVADGSDEMMNELRDLQAAIKPHEILFVARRDDGSGRGPGSLRVP